MIKELEENIETDTITDDENLDNSPAEVIEEVQEVEKNYATKEDLDIMKNDILESMKSMLDGKS